MTRSLLIALCAAVLPAACGRPVDETRNASGYGEPGTPLPGLTESELARFEAGRTWFDHGFTPEEGLGPLYNQPRCSSCHDLPEIGGYGSERLSKANRWDPASSRCDALDAQGGEIIQRQVTDAYRAEGGEPERVPSGATHVVQFVSSPAFGVGLIEAIPESEIERRADPDDSDGDGISGRVTRDAAGRLGRFGRRAGAPDLSNFVAGALVLEQGVTSAAFPLENTLNGQPLPPGADVVPDPEMNDSTLALIVDYVRFLALPQREAAAGVAADTIQRGERVFFEVGCALCHVPTLETGPNEVAALDRKVVALWSDLLLHDMGPEMASVCAGNAGPSEFRTTPLAGLRLRQPFMHNGAGFDLRESIELHGGESAASRDAFRRVDEPARDALLRFLRSL